ncbi:hypothetical protein NEOLEDRAFT_1094104 [Neolentinus lepideus HHB14362 ss-1]|uniref:Uncharacterized protein n=1 Tax=Neolentinus lepideus HHB14362 ss-1 TaxID=1314782 RepID=A0A165RYQ0_9AGAM|nr:hypothetical protein NEOLEDRAFT_1094104 [Neolentinus lepideus HHB14362 ss-1]
MSSTADQDEQQYLLQLLQAHGQIFLGSFDIPVPRPRKRRRTDEADSNVNNASKVEDHTGSEEEWTGFANDPSDSDDDKDFPSFDDGSNDDDFTANATNSHHVPVVVFDNGQKRTNSLPSGSKTGLKAFMSSKVSKLTQDSRGIQRRSVRTLDDEDEERTNVENDAELRRLIHTKLLSGSLNPDLDLKPAQRRKALEGRLLELAGDAKLGKGERSVKFAERNKAAQKVRLGMLAKQKEREEKQLEEAKNMGNYHPAIKKLFEPSEGQQTIRKRQRGLTMGVGKFKGGVLKLTKEEISSVQGSAPPRRVLQRGNGRPGGRRK